MTLDKSVGLSQCANSAAVFQIINMLFYVAKFWSKPWKEKVDVFDVIHGD